MMEADLKWNRINRSMGLSESFGNAGNAHNGGGSRVDNDWRRRI